VSIECVLPNIGFKFPGLLILDYANLVCVLPNIGWLDLSLSLNFILFI
jgi:hypothetical protein